MRHLIIALSFACMAAACPPSPAPQPQPTPDVPDVVPPADIDAAPGCSHCSNPCQCACCAMAWHNVDGVIRCKEALPTARGEDCEHVCLDTVTFPDGFGMPLSCIAKASSLDQLHACGVCR